MISKPSTRADELLEANEMIARAMARGPSDRIKKKMLAHRRGIIGEKQTAHILDRLFYDSKDHLVIHDLRIPDGIGSFAQFDHIILSRLSRKASVVEVKNYSGRMSRNQHDEWMVWYEGGRRPVQIPNPVAQARRQRDVLRAWLKAHDHDKAFSEVGTFVVIPSDGQIDRTKITEALPVYKIDNFHRAWVEFAGVSPIGKLFSSGVPSGTLAAIGAQLAAAHVSDEQTMAQRLGLEPRSYPHKGDEAAAQVDEPADEEQLAAEAAEAALDPDLSLPVREEEGEIVVISAEEEEADAPTPPVPEQEEALPVAKRKASAAVVISPGITERELPDGRIAFLAARDNEAAKERLTAACKGRARWQPRFQNWICSDDATALEIRTMIKDQSNEHQEEQDA
ncbi:nuclease-related domain-containing protein [Sphingomonas sp. 22176]|uniref:nuclease-related domain-containing protein n=1 Tax=Sphingomonas sp. 22176 TaxID=3453884 RepID=UPI003F87BB4F